MSANDLMEETVTLQVSINGHDFTTQNLEFTFYGTKTTEHARAWFVAIVIGCLVLLLLLYLLYKAFDPNSTFGRQLSSRNLFRQNPQG